MSLSRDKFKGDRDKHFQDPMKCYCLVIKKERSGNKTHHLKCWWYENGHRKFASFALTKYGYREALIRCMRKLRSKIQKKGD